MQPQSTASITPGILSSQFRLLSSSPAWPEVERVIRDLEVRGDELDEHVREQHEQILRSYVQLLRDQQPVIARGFICGLLIGRANGKGNFANALYHGLAALQESCGYDSATAGDALSRVMGEASEQFPELLAGLPESPASFDDVDAWNDWARDLDSHLSIDALAGDEVDGGLREAAWRGWDQRLRLYFGGLAEAEDPGFAEAVCFDRGVSPSNLLKFPVSNMTIREWSRCLLAGLTGGKTEDKYFAPAWMTAAAALQLGFPGLARSAIDSLGKADPDQAFGAIDEWRTIVDSRSESSRPAIMIVSSDNGAYDGWQLGSFATGVSLRPSDLEEYRHSDIAWPDPIEFVVVEQPQSSDSNVRAILKTLRSAPFLVPGEKIFDLLLEPPKTKQSRPFVVAPSGGIDELYRALVELREENVLKKKS